MNLDNMRRYGVELEFFYPRRMEDLAYTIMQETGIEVHCVNYSNRDTNLWRLKPDASLSAIRANRGTYYYPMELVTPILHGEEDMIKLRKVVEIINRDAKVNKQTGMHVHVDVGNADVKELRRFCCYAGKYERAINNILPMSRRESRWARNHLAEDASLDRFYGELTNRAKTGETSSLLAHRSFNGSGTRYMKWNFDNYWRTGTVENRAHSGTTDADKVENWVRLLQGIIQRNFAAKQMMITKIGSTASSYDTKHMLDDLVKNKVITNSVRKFYKARYEVLNNDVCR